MAEPLGDRDYFALRAEQERGIAGSCRDDAAARAHRRLADEYARRADEAQEAFASLRNNAAADSPELAKTWE